MLVDPDVIGVFLGAGIALKPRPRDRIERKALGAFVALLGARPVEGPFAFAAVEAGDMTTVERHPDNAVAVDVHAANAKAGQRDAVELGHCRVGRV